MSFEVLAFQTASGLILTSNITKLTHTSDAVIVNGFDLVGVPIGANLSRVSGSSPYYQGVLRSDLYSNISIPGVAHNSNEDAYVINSKDDLKAVAKYFYGVVDLSKLDSFWTALNNASRPFAEGAKVSDLCKYAVTAPEFFASITSQGAFGKSVVDLKKFSEAKDGRDISFKLVREDVVSLLERALSTSDRQTFILSLSLWQALNTVLYQPIVTIKDKKVEEWLSGVFRTRSAGCVFSGLRRSGIFHR